MKLIIDVISAGRFQKNFWRKRHLLKDGDWQNDEDWVMGYWNSRHHPHRQMLIEKIGRYLPSSVLEIGANCGPNMYVLAKKFPSARFVGIDINEKSIEAGKKLLSGEGIFNVEMLNTETDQLSQFSNKSFDIVLSDAVLMYVGPNMIMQVMGEIFRIARKALIFVEWHEPSKRDNKGLGVYHYGHWKRDYIKLAKQFVHEDKIVITKIPEKIWPGNYWSQLGYIIEIALQ